ncbi:MAG TPA: TIGR03619 family F420-dependent LLM class oxidoreductase [Spongiibacteraceae bacterium]|nr:TIGR03619 family F420-dependent LLM class oxidoreductase [Spongiibacteraceae bacterium]
MQYWLAWFHEGNDQLKAVAKAAEAMGFAGIAVSDHVAMPRDYRSVHPSGQRHIHAHTRFPDAMISIATMAAVTTTLKFMTYVYVLPMREPFSAAKQAATLAMQTDNRFIFGVGAGWCEDEIALLGHDPRQRGRRMDAMLSVMQDFWDDGYAEADNAFYRFPITGQFPAPGKVPVWIGGKSPAALRRAARHDGWLGMNYPMEEIRELLAQLNHERDKHEAETGKTPFGRFVIPMSEPDTGVYHQLEDWGIDGTIAMAWTVDDPLYHGLEAKLEAMQQFADRFIRP